MGLIECHLHDTSLLFTSSWIHEKVHFSNTLSFLTKRNNSLCLDGAALILEFRQIFQAIAPKLLQLYFQFA